MKAGHWNDTNSQLLTIIGKTITIRSFEAFNLQAICILAWSFSVGGKFELIESWLIAGLKQLTFDKISELKIEGIQQLYGSFLQKALREQRWSKENPDGFLQTYLSEALTEKILALITETRGSEGLQRGQWQEKVNNMLQDILPKNYSIREEYYIKPYFVDFGIFEGEKLVAVLEANGPTHFMLDGTYDLMHRFKEWQIKQMSVSEVINIDYNEWQNYQDKRWLFKEKLSGVVKVELNEEEHKWSKNKDKNEMMIKKTVGVHRSEIGNDRIKKRKFERIEEKKEEEIKRSVRRRMNEK